MAEKKSTSEKAGKKRAYSKYVQDPVFVGLIVLSVLLAMATVLIAANVQCATCPPCPDPTGGVVVVDDANDTVVVDDTDDVGDKIVIYEFSEFACPYCGAAAGWNQVVIDRLVESHPGWEAPVPKIAEEYGDQVEVEFKHFIVHEQARKASEAAECARDQGKFWEMHDTLFQNQGALEVDDLKGYAADLGLDTEKFNACLDNGEKASVVEADTKLGKDLGVTGTPSFMVGGENGYKIVGAQPFTNFVEPIEKVLKGELPPPPPEKGPSIGTFDSLILEDGVCAEDGKPVIRLFTTTWCPHCTWAGPRFDEVMKEYVDAGKIVAHHWQVDSGDDSLTEEVETAVPESELAVYQQFNSRGSVPTFVFGCKYYRIGTGHEQSDDLEAEAEEYREVIDALIEELAA